MAEKLCTLRKSGGGASKIVELGSGYSTTEYNLTISLNDSLNNYKFIIFAIKTTLDGQKIVSSPSETNILGIDEVKHFKTNPITGVTYIMANYSTYNATLTYVSDTSVSVTNVLARYWRVYGIK